VSTKPGSELTKLQRDMAELLQLGDPETGEHYSVVKACEKLGIARSTYYEWTKKESFVQYMDYLADMALKSRIGKYDRILDQLATNSKNEKIVIDAINTLLKRAGKFKNEVNLNANIEDSRSITELSTDELRRRLLERKHKEDESSG
jgi:ACT domain-containing protein